MPENILEFLMQEALDGGQVAQITILRMLENSPLHDDFQQVFNIVNNGRTPDDVDKLIEHISAILAS